MPTRSIARRALLASAPLLLGSIPSFYELTLRNELAAPLRFVELYGSASGRVGAERSIAPGASGSFSYLARHVGLMGCVAVPNHPAGLLGWTVIDPRGRTAFIPRERLSELRVTLSVRDEHLARGRLE